MTARSGSHFLFPWYFGALNQNHTRNPAKAISAAIIPTSSPAERYFPIIFPISDSNCRSGPVKGVTRFSSTTPLITPSSSQKLKATTRANTLLRNRYATLVVVKIRNPLYKKTRGLSVIKCHALRNECLDMASITRYRRQHPSACKGTENLLHTCTIFALSTFIFFIYFLSCSSRSSTWANILI